MNDNISFFQKRFNEFVAIQPYWLKYLSNKILSGNTIKQEDIDNAYEYFLEDIGVCDRKEREEISLDVKLDEKNFSKDISLKSVTGIKGINALEKNQTITFSPALTIIYGMNGAGKSGYVRLLTNAFYSKHPSVIIPNIYSSVPEKQEAIFSFCNSENAEISYKYPEEIKQRNEHFQFSIYDNMAATTILNEHSEYEFIPSILEYFTFLTRAVNDVEKKINTENVNKAASIFDFSKILDGESKIKEFLCSLSFQTNLDTLKDYLPFTDADIDELYSLEKEKAQLMALNKEEEIKKLKDILSRFEKVISQIVNLNLIFSSEKIEALNVLLKDYSDLQKEKEAKSQKGGVNVISAESGHDSNEWKDFLHSAYLFVTKHHQDYPQSSDKCIFCNQLLSMDAQKLIFSYWNLFDKILTNKENKLKESIFNEISLLEKVDLNLIDKNTVLGDWIFENENELYNILAKKLSQWNSLLKEFIVSLKNYSPIKYQDSHLDTNLFNSCKSKINTKIEEYMKLLPSEKINIINCKITYLTHKQKLNTHLQDIKYTHATMIWIHTVTNSKIAPQKFKKRITDKGKEVSNELLNSRYLEFFNEECKFLNANFNLEINYKGSDGKTLRYFQIKKYRPVEILSEGEQKVSSLADFLAEIRMTDINRGIIFDDPVNSLDEARKSKIAERLVLESLKRQVIIFTHDLVFLSSLVEFAKKTKIIPECHWIEKVDSTPGIVYLNNSPAYEKQYKTSQIPQKHLQKARGLPPAEREAELKLGFATLRTCYEALVVFDLFNGVVQRFNERISVESLSEVFFSDEIRNLIGECFSQCCRYMEGHLHSDKYSYIKPSIQALDEEIHRFDEAKKKIKEAKKVLKL